MVKQPLEPFVRRDDAEGKIIRLHPQEDLVQGHDNRPAMPDIGEILENDITLSSLVIPKLTVKSHGIAKGSGHLGNQVTVPFPEIDQFDFTRRQMAYPLCPSHKGCPEKQDQHNPSLYEAVHRFKVRFGKMMVVR